MASPKKPKKNTIALTVTDRRFIPTSRATYVPAKPSTYETIDGSSLTVPDMALSPMDIINRHTSGRPLPELRDHAYHMDIELPDIRTLDLVERDELLQWAKKNVTDADQAYKTKMELRRAAAAKQKEELNALRQFVAQHNNEMTEGGTTEGNKNIIVADK